MRQAEASAEISKLNLSYTQLYAPTDGTILTRIREPGTVTRAGDPVYTLSILSPVWIRCFITEPQLSLVYPGMPAEIYTDTPNHYTGQVGFISPIAEFTPKTVQTTELRTDGRRRPDLAPRALAHGPRGSRSRDHSPLEHCLSRRGGAVPLNPPPNERELLYRGPPAAMAERVRGRTFIVTDIAGDRRRFWRQLKARCHAQAD